MSRVLRIGQVKGEAVVRSAGASQAAARVPFHVIAKPSGSTCNLRCEYCFFLGKSALYDGQAERMTAETLERYLGQLLAAHPDGEVVVAWQGGEPTLMGLDFFRSAVETAERYRRPGQRLLHTIQTNATLLDKEWARFLAENGFLVGVSIDGPASVHDVYRRDRTGSPTHARVMRALAVLDESGVEWNALVAVHAASQGKGAEVYRFLRDQASAQFLQFIPIVERLSRGGVAYGEAVTERSVSPSGYARFLCDVFDEWVRNDVGRVFVQSFDSALTTFAGEGHPLCVHAPTCGRAVALEFNGDVYSCDHFVDPAHLLGRLSENALGELIDSEQQRDFGRSKLTTLPNACADCRVRALCNGGCPKDRFGPGTDDGPKDNYLCAGYRAFFEHIEAPMRMMTALLRRGHAPAEIMSVRSGGG